MARVTVSPHKFTMVFFDPDRIKAVAEETADAVGLPADLDVRIEIDEVSPLGRSTVTSLEPVTISVEGGAFENAKKPRHMSETGIRDVLSRLFFRVQDRLSGSFDEAPADADLSLQQSTAWDAYAVGRSERSSLTDQKSRRLYHFRNRHGFSDAADRVFERLWTADGLSWADIQAACDETARAREAAPAAVVRGGAGARRCRGSGRLGQPRQVDGSGDVEVGVVPGLAGFAGRRRAGPAHRHRATPA